MLSITVPHLLTRCEEAVFSAEGLLAAAKSSVAELVTQDGKISSEALDREQRACHALAWLATYVEALRQMVRWARGLEETGLVGDRAAEGTALVTEEFALEQRVGDGPAVDGEERPLGAW